MFSYKILIIVLINVYGLNQINCSGGFGVTYSKMMSRINIGLDFIGCSLNFNERLDRPYKDPISNETKCNPYQGDTSCSRQLPILCILKSNIPWPFSNLINNTADIHWSGSIVATTMPIMGYLIRNVDYMNFVCEKNFGPGWRAFDFEFDGLTWYFTSLSNVRGDTRFWIWINSQSGNCWDA